MGVYIDEVVSEIGPETSAAHTEAGETPSDQPTEDMKRYEFLRIFKRIQRRQERLIAD